MAKLELLTAGLTFVLGLAAGITASAGDEVDRNLIGSSFANGFCVTFDGNAFSSANQITKDEMILVCRAFDSGQKYGIAANYYSSTHANSPTLATDIENAIPHHFEDPTKPTQFENSLSNIGNGNISAGVGRLKQELDTPAANDP